jgi:hypothetical protein
MYEFTKEIYVDLFRIFVLFRNFVIDNHAEPI